MTAKPQFQGLAVRCTVASLSLSAIVELLDELQGQTGQTDRQAECNACCGLLVGGLHRKAGVRYQIKIKVTVTLTITLHSASSYASSSGSMLTQ